MNPEQSVDSSQIHDLFERQLISWPLLRDNYQAYQHIQINEIFIDDIKICVQFNPSRIVSSGAKTDRQSLQKRKCFLCKENLPPEQEYIPFGKDYLILCNPFPIFPEHFTVPTRQHVDQSILGRFGDMLDLAQSLENYTIFYNGPTSGASAPDHMHFQIVTRNYMPIDTIDASHTEILKEKEGTSLYLLKNYFRNGFIIKSENKKDTETLFEQVCRGIGTPENEPEPKMNIFSTYTDGVWEVKIIPRRTHRPWQFFAEGNDFIMTSPGAADIGGVFITSREEDFKRINPELLRDIYNQICFTTEEIKAMM